MWGGFKAGREDRLWRAGVAAAAAGNDEMRCADSGAAWVLRERRVCAPSEEADAILERALAHSKDDHQRDLRLLAYAPSITLPVALAHGQAHMERAVKCTAAPGAQSADWPRSFWVLGMLSQRRPDAFGARLADHLAQLSEAVTPTGAIVRAGIMQGVARGLRGEPGAANLRSALLAHIQSTISQFYSALARLLSLHARRDPALGGVDTRAADDARIGGDARARDVASVGAMREFCERCLQAYSDGAVRRLQLAEAIARISPDAGQKVLFRSLTRLLTGEGEAWVQLWNKLDRLLQQKKYAEYVLLALGIVDTRVGGDALAYFMGDLLHETAAISAPWPACAFDAVTADDLANLQIACSRLMAMNPAWQKLFPPTLQARLGHIERSGKLDAWLVAGGRHLDATEHAVVRAVQALMTMRSAVGLSAGGPDDPFTPGRGGIFFDAARYRFAFKPADGCSWHTLRMLRDTLGDYLIEHQQNPEHIKLAIGLFADTLMAESGIVARRVLAAGCLLQNVATNSNAVAPMLRMLRCLQVQDGRAVASHFAAAADAGNEIARFFLMEWLCTSGHADLIQKHLVKDALWAKRLKNHAQHSARAPWAPLHLESWKPDKNELVRLDIYARVQHEVVPAIEDANLRKSAAHLLAFLVAGEGPAQPMVVTNWTTSGDPLSLAPHPNTPFTSLRESFRVARLATSRVVNIKVQDGCVVAHGEMVPDVYRFVALATDEIGRAITTMWQEAPPAQAADQVTALLSQILVGNACLDGWVTNLNTVMQQRATGIDGESFDMVIDLDNKHTDHDRCSEYLRVFRLRCGQSFRKAQALPSDTPFVTFEERRDYIREYFNADAFARFLRQHKFASKLTLDALIAYQVDVVGVLERA